MSTSNHYFFAVKLPMDIKENLNISCNNLRDIFPFKKWVHEKDYHITLAFLGSSPLEKLVTAINDVQQALQEMTEFNLTINKYGTFGKSDEPRIFWAGLEKDQRLEELRAKVYAACIKSGFILETRPFSPHITLARKWNGNEQFSKEKLQAYGVKPISFIAREVVLYQTHLDRLPKYEAIETFQLKSNLV